MNCNDLLVEFKVDGSSPYVFGSKVTSVDVSLSPANASNEITINCVNEDYVYDEDSILGSEHTIKIGNYSFKMIAVDYSINTVEGGSSSLSVSFIDNSYRFLDKNIVLLRSLHLGLVNKENVESNITGEWAYNKTDWPSSFLVVGKEYKTVNIKNYPPLTFTRVTELTSDTSKYTGIGWVDLDALSSHPWIIRQTNLLQKLLDQDPNRDTSKDKKYINRAISNFLLKLTKGDDGEFLYKLKDLIENESTEFPVPISDTVVERLNSTDGYSSVLNSYHGTLRDVLNSWGSDLGIIFFWDSEQEFLDFYKLKDLPAISSTIKSLENPANLKTSSSSGSIRDTLSKGVVASYQENNYEDESWSTGETTNQNERGAYLVDFHSYLISINEEKYAALYPLLSLMRYRQEELLTENQLAVLFYILKDLKSRNQLGDLGKTFQVINSIFPQETSQLLEESFKVKELSASERTAFLKQYLVKNPGFRGSEESFLNLIAYESPTANTPASMYPLLSSMANISSKYFVRKTTYGKFSTGNWSVVDKQDSGLVFAPYYAKANIFIPELIELEERGFVRKNISVVDFISYTVNEYRNLSYPRKGVPGKEIEDLMTKDSSGQDIFSSAVRGFALVTKQKEFKDSPYLTPYMRGVGGPVEINFETEESKTIMVFSNSVPTIVDFFKDLSKTWISYATIGNSEKIYIEFSNTTQAQIEFDEEEKEILLGDGYYKRVFEQDSSNNVLRYEIDFLDMGPYSAYLSRQADNNYFDYLAYKDSEPSYRKTFNIVGVPEINFADQIKEGLSSMTIDYSGGTPVTNIEYSTRKAFLYTRDVYNSVSYAQQPTSRSKSVKRTYSNDYLSTYTKNLFFK